MTDSYQHASATSSASGAITAEHRPEEGAGFAGMLASLAGVLSAAAALATGELFSGISSNIRSLVIGVAEAMVDWTPGFIARWSIDQFGKHQKTLLVWGIVVVALALGSLIGRLAQRHAAVGPIAFALFGVVGGFTAARVPGASAGLAWVSAIVAAAVGAALLWFLLRELKEASTATESSAARSRARRSFLSVAGGAAVAALGAWTGGAYLRNRFNVNAAREAAAGAITTRSEAVASAATSTPSATAVAAPTVDAAIDPGVGAGIDLPVPTAASYDSVVENITPLIMPNDRFYRIDTALVVPQVDPDSWSMRITGLVDNELEFTYQDLLDRASVEEAVTLSCVSNPVGGDLVGNAVWLGVPLRDLLDEAGVQPAATQLASRSVDGWSCGFPTSALDDPDRTALVAIAMNGEPLPTSHGFPARLVVAGLYGYVSATKWLSEVELTTWEDFDGYWIPRGWSKEGPIKTQSRIDVPRNAAKIPPGVTTIAGIAWAPNIGIELVEVSVDDGPWEIAEMIIEPSINTWRQWKLDHDLSPGQHMIKVRATDASGYVQPELRTAVAPDGATGHHTIAVKVQS